jgi:hypothetical protein
MFFLAGLALVVGTATADPIPPAPNDPRINISDPPCLTCTSVTGLQFSFVSNGIGMGNFGFTNLSGINWFNVQVVAEVVPGVNFPAGYSCVTDVFQFCTFTMSGNQIIVDFFGLIGFTGITPGMNFFVDLTGDVGWVANSTFTVTANVPEPATLALLGTALLGAAVGLRRKAGSRR